MSSEPIPGGVLLRFIRAMAQLKKISLYPRDYVAPSHINSGLGHVSCFGQRDFGRCGAIRSLKSPHVLEFVSSCCLLGILTTPCDKKRR